MQQPTRSTTLDRIISRLINIEDSTEGNISELALAVRTDFNDLIIDLKDLAKDLEKPSHYFDDAAYAEGYEQGKISAADRINEIIG